MAIQTQFRRGNTYSHSLFTGASGEITVDLDKKVAVVHDGATVGGHPLSLNSYTAAAYNQANTASTIAGLAFNAANSASSSSVTSVGGASGVISNVQLAAGITSSGLLTTANISELTNLYFTNARSRATISIASGNVNGKGSYDSATGVISINAANVTVSSSAPTDPYIGDVWIHADTAVEYLYFNDGTSFQWAEIGTGGTGSSLTTANVTELTNLYFTNERVYSNVAQLGYITSTSLSGYATNTQLGTYATNAQLTSYATTTNVALKANVIDLTTANVTEVTNQYFTNARAIAAVTNTTLSNITVSGNIILNSYSVGYLEAPQNSQNTSYTLTLTDSGKHIYSQNTDTQVLTIPTNANVAFNVGTMVSIVLQGSGSMTVSPFSGVTLYLAGNSTSASRTISTYGMATLVKVATNTWFINGSGVS